jgi:hypothetical protein
VAGSDGASSYDSRQKYTASVCPNFGSRSADHMLNRLVALIINGEYRKNDETVEHQADVWTFPGNDDFGG